MVQGYVQIGHVLQLGCLLCKWAARVGPKSRGQKHTSGLQGHISTTWNMGVSSVQHYGCTLTLTIQHYDYTEYNTLPPLGERLAFGHNWTTVMGPVSGNILIASLD